MDLSAAVPPDVCSLVWLNGQSDTELCTTSVTVMELQARHSALILQTSREKGDDPFLL